MTCSAEEVICPALEANNSLIEYRVDESYDYYLNNWFVQMDLLCSNPVVTSSMISAKYIAYGIAGLLLFAMPDRYGRKFTMIVNFAVHLVAQYLILFESAYWARSMGLILYGVA